MKIAISGKGGVGKTTLCALLAQEAVAEGKRVLAVDADPNPTLAMALGFPDEITPLVELKELMEERMGSLEGFLRLNPTVDDIPERFAVERDGIKLLVMGPIRQGGGGCACPQNTFLKNLLQHLVLERNELILLDFEAGLEPLGRATAQGVDALLIVVEPDGASVVTARRICALAQQIGVQRICAVANKIREPKELRALSENLEIAMIGALPYSERLRLSIPISLDCDAEVRHHVQAIFKSVQLCSST